MQLTSNTHRSHQRRERFWLGGTLLLLLIGVAWLMLGYRAAATPAAPSRIACDAERVRGEAFVNGDHEFGGGQLQSRDYARSGLHACRLPRAEETQYGFSYQLRGFEPGEVFRASVWRRRQAETVGLLAVQGNDPPGLYYQTGDADTIAPNGWEQLSITFHIPYHAPPQSISIYVYTNGEADAYFDDLLIEKVDYWEASLFRPHRLQLRLDDRAMRELNQKRDEAMAAGILESEEGDWVSGQLQSDGAGPMPVKVRLKGDWLDHLSGDKWSFRVSMKDGHAWNRLLVFSLHTPAARQFLHEWLLHEIWEREDVLTTRYDFVELYLNDKSLGIYAYEEHFEKQLVESRRRREGPILKLDETGFWAGIGRQLQQHGFVRPGSSHSAMHPANAPLNAFNEDDLAADPTLSATYIQARDLLEAYLQGKKSPQQVFDLKLLARYYAACDALNAYHAVSWHNQRFYYNPISKLLEPIGFDGFGGGAAPHYTFLAEGALNTAGLDGQTLYAALLQDTAFVTRYLAELYRMTSRAYWRQLQDSLTGQWTARLRWLNMEFPDYQASLKNMATEARYVHSLLLPFPEGSLRTYRLPGGRLQVTNTHTLPLIIQGFGATANHLTRDLATPHWLAGQTPRRYLTRLRRDSLIRNFDHIRFLHEEALNFQGPPPTDTLALPSDVNYVFFRLPGVDSLFSAPINTWAPPKELVIDGRPTASRPADFPTLLWQEGDVLIPAGSHRLAKDLVVPEGAKLRIAPGAVVDLTNGAAIISFGPVQAIGNTEAPIRIISSDGNNSGFQVIQPQGISTLKDVHFDRLSTMQRRDWTLTGAVTFYEAEVTFKHCSFTNNESEDGLNLVRSRYLISECLFANTSSDAFDSDFCTGKVEDCIFRSTVNDGADFSGSVVTVSNCRFEKCGDKGISVGEESDVTVIKADIRNSNIGIASKDFSVCLARQVNLRNCKQGFVTYQKKPEFGPARLLVESYTADQVDKLYQSAPGNIIQLEHQLIQ